MNQRTKIYCLIGLSLLFSILMTGLAFAENGLAHFAPREVEKLPISLQATDSTVIQSDARGINTLEKQVGFAILLPTSLPSGCRLSRSMYGAAGNSAILHYSCAFIIERKTEITDHPLVALKSTHQTTVAGKPALVIDGVWEEQPSGRTTWSSEFKTLVFEQNGLVIRILANGLSDDQLIKIAESMK